MLLVLAALRATVPFSPYASHGPHSPRAGSTLLSQHDSNVPDVYYNAVQAAEERYVQLTIWLMVAPSMADLMPLIQQLCPDAAGTMRNF